MALGGNHAIAILGVPARGKDCVGRNGKLFPPRHRRLPGGNDPEDLVHHLLNLPKERREERDGPLYKDKEDSNAHEQLCGQAEREQVGLGDEAREDAQRDVGQEEDHQERRREPDGEPEEVPHPPQHRRPGPGQLGAAQRYHLKRLRERPQEEVVPVGQEKREEKRVRENLAKRVARRAADRVVSLREAQRHLVPHDRPREAHRPEDDARRKAHYEPRARLHQHDQCKPDIVGHVVGQGACGKPRQAVGQHHAGQHPHPHGDGLLLEDRGR